MRVGSEAARVWIATACVVLLLPAIASAQTGETPSAEAGLRALDAGDPATAVPLLEQATREHPDDPFLFYALGICLAGMERDEQAVRAFDRAASLDPLLRGVQAELGLALYRLGDTNAAETHLLEALLQGPEDAYVLLHLGLLDVESGELDRAIQLFQDAASVDPTIAATALYEAADAALAQNDLEATERYLEQAIASEGPATARDRARRLLAVLRPEPPRRIALRAGAGIEYDDNLTVSAADLTTGVGDVAAVLDAGIALYPVRRPDVELAIGYDFYQSLYRTETGLDLQSHSPFIRLRAGNGRLIGEGSYRYTDDSLGGDDFLSTHRGDLRGELTLAPWLVGLMGVRIEGLRFAQTPERDVQRLSVEIGARLTDTKGRASFGLSWRPVWAYATGPEFDYRAHIISSELGYLLPAGERLIDIHLSYDRESRDYDNLTPRIRARRRDERNLFGAGIATTLIGPTEVSFEYLYISYSSNLPELNYGENIVTFRIGAYY